MSYYYGDYYGEEATPCDPYYDDCTDAAVDEEPEEDYYGEEMVEEESSAGVPMLVMAWGLVPVLDIASGLWINNDWSELADADVADNTVWQNSFYASVATGGLGLVMWGATVFMGPPFGMWFAVNVVLEAVNLYLVYAAEDKYPNNSTNFVNDDGTDASTMSTVFAYGAHGFGLVFSGAAAAAAMSMGGAPEEEYADEYADEEPADEEPVDEEPADDTYGDYYGYY